MKNVCARILGIAIMLGTACPAVVSQTPDTDPDFAVRDMNASAFFQNRPKRKDGPRPRRYRKSASSAALVAEPANPRDNRQSDAEVGVTIWRLKQVSPDDRQARRDITHEEAGVQVDFVAGRVMDGDGLTLGDRFRFSIETPRKGFLYVINQSRYDDGLRDPVLIYPTLRIRGGANEVRGGRLVELPSRHDWPPYYRITSGKGSRLLAEEVIVLVTPKPLDLTIGDRPLPLTAEQVAAWERRWGAKCETLETVDEKQTVYTQEERKAGTDPNALLTQDDPGPQTIYRLAAGPDDPLFLRVVIPVQPGGAAERRPVPDRLKIPERAFATCQPPIVRSTSRASRD